MTMIVVLNDFIGARGVSGSSMGATQVARALAGGGTDVYRMTIDREPKSRVGRLAGMLRWDFVHTPRTASKVDACCIVHCSNTGLGARHIPSIVIMHDTMVLDHPSLFDRGYNAYARMAFGISVRAARVVVTPSEHSKNRILARWPETSVVVIPWPTQPFRPNANPSGYEERMRKPTVLAVASTDRHKRLDIAVNTVSTARRISGIDFGLTLVARRGNAESAVQRAIGRVDPEHEWIEVVRGISSRRLSDLYDNAFCLIVASLDEGFCLPALEAASHGLPVVHTARGALAEVMGGDPASGCDYAADEARLLESMISICDSPAWESSRARSIERAWVSTGPEEFRDRWRLTVKEVGS